MGAIAPAQRQDPVRLEQHRTRYGNSEDKRDR